MRLALVLALGLAHAAGAETACTQGLCYSDAGGPIGYDHAILGATPEWREVTYQGKAFRFDSGFFEDIAPYVGEIDGLRVAIVVHTDLELGARLVVLSLPDLAVIAATPHIGQRHRWLAVAGIGDFGDGANIAYVDRPHLARELVFLRLKGDQLTEVGRVRGVTNHRIGDAVISSSIADCGAGDAVILRSADWSRKVAVRVGMITAACR